MTLLQRGVAKARSVLRAQTLGLPARVAPRPDDVWCSVCRKRSRRFVRHRSSPQAMCPRCGSLARHRVLASYLGSAIDHDLQSILHFAPEATISRLLRPRALTRYVTADLEPRHSLALDITSLPFPDDSFDLVVCCHVLEHIPDDHAAMRELARITTSPGALLVQVPWIPMSTTDEDPTATAEERIRRFGQADHVRMYGGDIVERMERAGLSTSVVAATQLSDFSRIGSPSDQVIFVGRPSE